MPVVQLQDDTGANLGAALGTAAGYFATRKQRAAKNALDNQTAKAYADNITSEIQSRNAATQQSQSDYQAKQLQEGLATKYAGLIKAGPPKGVDPMRWAASLQAQANADGLTDPNLRAQLVSEAQATIAANAPKLSEVEHGLPQPVTSGKGAWTPQQTSQHYIQAAARVMSSNMPDDQKKTLAGQYLQMAQAATKDQPPQITPYQQQELGIQSQRLGVERQNANRPRVGNGRGSDGLTPYERITLGHWNQTHNPDGTVKSGAYHDTTGLTSMGRTLFDQDMQNYNRAIILNPNDPPVEPNPMDPKYAKRPGSGGGNAGASGSSGSKFVPGHIYTDANGNKARYNADGSWTPQP